MELMFDLDVQVQSTTLQSPEASWSASCFCSIGTDSSCWLDPM